MEKDRIYSVPIFVSQKGCKNDCIFCNQKHITGSAGELDVDIVKSQIEQSLKTINTNYQNILISFFGGSFTAIEKEKQIALLECAKTFITAEKAGGVRISTRPDCINTEILTYLREYHVKIIELGVQSSNDDVLNKNKRGHAFSVSVNASKLIKDFGFSLGLQMMTDMYFSDDKKDYKTAEDIIALKPDFVRIYPTVVIKNTELQTLYQQGLYKVKSFEDTVLNCAKILKLFNDHHIRVVRLGLMASFELEGNIIAGAYHPAFREIVESKMIYDEILNQVSGKQGKNLIIEVAEKNLSRTIGNAKSNILKLKENTHFEHIKVIMNNCIVDFKITID